VSFAPRLTLVDTNPLETRFRRLFQADFRYVWASLGRLGVDEKDREDLASEVFLRVSERMEDFDPTRPPRPWLFAFAVRVASEHRRRARACPEVLGTSVDIESIPIAVTPSDIGDRELVQLGLNSLDMEKRAVFVMHYLDEFTAPEIARALGIPLGTAYTRLRAARDLFTATVRRLRRSAR